MLDNDRQMLRLLAWLVAITILYTGLVVGAFMYAHAQKPEEREAGREYFPVSIEALATGKNFHTHVRVAGKVTLTRHEADGDTHIRLEDADKNFVVAECIPSLMCTTPQIGSNVVVEGISRFDGEHKWYEVHPVERLTQ